MNIEKAQETMERNENKHKKKGPQFKKGDKVWLHTKNLKTKRPNKKLDHIKVGPFFIKSVKRPVNYELELLAYAKVHPVFYISLFEKVANNIPISEEFMFEPEEDARYEIEKILKKQKNQYLVKWKEYPESENSWEPVENLLPNCSRMLQQFQDLERWKATQRNRPRNKRPDRRS